VEEFGPAGFDPSFVEQLRSSAASVLKHRFGFVPQQIRGEISRWPEARLHELVEKTCRIDFLDELRLTPADEP
jgi:hypothetical protein